MFSSVHFSPKPGLESFDYLVKWQGLPYSECTHEDSELITRRFPEAVQEYETRQKSSFSPSKYCKVSICLSFLFVSSKFRKSEILKWMCICFVCFWLFISSENMPLLNPRVWCLLTVVPWQFSKSKFTLYRFFVQIMAQKFFPILHLCSGVQCRSEILLSIMYVGFENATKVHSAEGTAGIHRWKWQAWVERLSIGRIKLASSFVVQVSHLVPYCTSL